MIVIIFLIADYFLILYFDDNVKMACVKDRLEYNVNLEEMAKMLEEIKIKEARVADLTGKKNSVF